MTTTTESSVMQSAPGAAYAVVQLGPSPARAPDVLPNPAMPATSDATVIQLGGRNGLPPTLAFKQILAKTEPKYLGSFGSVAFEHQIAPGLKMVGWRVIGTVQRIWADLETSLAGLVTSKRQELELQRPGGSLATPVWMLRCFLLGHDKDRATPHVVVLCAAKWLRQAIGKLIVRSRLLVAFKFKCCALPFIAELDMAPASTPMASARPESPENPDSFHNLSVYSPHIWPMSPLGGLSNDFSLDCDLSGTQLIVTFHTPLGDVTRHATIGGMVSVNAQNFGLTVLHVFQNPEVSGDTCDQEDGDWTMELFDEKEDLDPGTTAAGDGAQAYREQILQAEPPNYWEHKPDFSRATPLPVSLGLYHRLQLIALSTDARYDWALIKGLTQSVNNMPCVRTWPSLPSDQVVIKTSSGEKYGRLESSGIFGLPVSGDVQPVMVATMSDKVQPGDSGAWAMKLQDGTFTGMLIGSCPRLGEAYLVRMDDCLRNIGQQIGGCATISRPIGEPISADGQEFHIPAPIEDSGFLGRPAYGTSH